MLNDLLTLTDKGLYCEAGGFHVDPWGPVDRAIVTHAHGDHARPGSRRYLVAERGLLLARARLGESATIEHRPYHDPVVINDVRVTLIPAGHVLGSAQIRIEDLRSQSHTHDRVWVVSGDYKRVAEPTCEQFEPSPCDVFITESTFGLPIYRWEPAEVVFEDLNAWWRTNAAQGLTSVVFVYALGKAQRILRGADPSIGPILTHGAMTRINRAYEASGVSFPAWMHASPEAIKAHKKTALVIAPPSARNSPWVRRFRPYSDAFVSGWMLVRGARRQRSVDRGFVLSDHADWPGLTQTIQETGARRVGVTHGYTAPMVRWLKEQGRDAWEVPTRFEGERGELNPVPEEDDRAGDPAESPPSAEEET